MPFMFNLREASRVKLDRDQIKLEETQRAKEAEKLANKD